MENKKECVLKLCVLQAACENHELVGDSCHVLISFPIYGK